MPRARQRRPSGRERVRSELVGYPSAPAGSVPYPVAVTSPPPVASTPPGAGPAPEDVLRQARQADRESRWDDALGLLSAGIDQAAESVELLTLRGTLLSRLRRFAEADADLRRALRLRPADGPALLELGILQWRKGLAAEAADILDRAAAHQPQNPAAFNYLAEALNQTGQCEGAVVALERSLALDPRQPRAYHLMGRILDRLRRPDEARQAYCRGRELTGQ